MKKVCLDKLRHSPHVQKLESVHAELESNVQLKDLVSTLYNDFEDAPIAEYWIS